MFRSDRRRTELSNGKVGRGRKQDESGHGATGSGSAGSPRTVARETRYDRKSWIVERVIAAAYLPA